MRFGVLSDTHLTSYSRGFVKSLRKAFRGVERIIHCGDFVDLVVLDMLLGEGWDVLGVAGNMDNGDILNRLPKSKKVRCGEKTIGVIHGWGSPSGIEQRVINAFADVDVVVFGHTHRPHWARWGQVWLFNPGAACGWGSSTGPTVGLLDIGEEVQGLIIPLSVRDYE